MYKCDFLIIGCGFSGSVLAERIANELNKSVLIIDKRNHIGGNCYDEFDENGILIHKYGPHIFHTNEKYIVDYLSQFTDWYRYEHQVLAFSTNEYYNIPININTINKVFNVKLENEFQAREFLEKYALKRFPIRNSEDIIVNQVGYELFEKFFKHYTKKQWGVEPSELSPAVCGRINVRYNFDNRYFTDTYQIMPLNGFTKLFEKMLDNRNIKIILGKDFKQVINDIDYKFLIFTGPIDEFFNYKFGKLGYRSIDFEWKTIDKDSYQPSPVVNHTDDDVPYTRVTEYKKITKTNSSKTTISIEYPNGSGEPYYPIISEPNKAKLALYLSEANKLKNIIFCGRLGEFRYYDMEHVVARSLKIFESKIFSHYK